jgi:hypothetical protein
MPKSRWTKWLGVARDTRASEVAEAAMVFPLFFMAFLAVFWFGYGFLIFGTLTSGTRAAAEVAVAPACTTCTATATPAANAQAAVYNALASAHLNKTALVPYGLKWTPPVLCPCGSTGSSCASSSISCNGSITDVCVQENVQLSYSGKGGAGTCGTSVSVRYQIPFHFTIPCVPQPCTALDLGNMLIAGQSEMREETQ